MIPALVEVEKNSNIAMGRHNCSILVLNEINEHKIPY